MSIRLKYHMSLFILVGVLFGYCGFAAAHGNSRVIAIMVGVRAHSDGARVLGIPLQEVIMIGHPQDIAQVLESEKYFSYRFCNCLAEGAESVGWCMVQTARRVSVPRHLTEIPEEQVIVQTRPDVFTDVFNAIRLGAGSSGPPRQTPIILPPRGRGPLPPGFGSLCQKSLRCEPASEVEVNTQGETKFVVGCEEGVKIEMSTSGSVGLKLGGRGIWVAVPLQPGR